MAQGDGQRARRVGPPRPPEGRGFIDQPRGERHPREAGPELVPIRRFESNFDNGVLLDDGQAPETSPA